MTAAEALRELSVVMSAQWGMATTAQAARVGVTRLTLSRLGAAGHLHRIAHGVYRSAAVPPSSLDELRAAWLALDPPRTAETRLRDLAADAIVAGPTAAHLLQIGEFIPEPFEFAVPTRRQTQKPDVLLRHLSLDTADVTLREGLPVMTPERTIADLVARSHDLTLVANALADIPSPDRAHLAALLDPQASRHHQESGAHLLEELWRLVGRSPVTVARRQAAATIPVRLDVPLVTPTATDSGEPL